MGYEIPVLTDSTKEADVDLSARQYYWVKETATGWALPTAATDKPGGILQNAPKAGETAQVMRLGVSKSVCGGNIAVGDSVGTDANGKSDTKIHGTDTTNYVSGTALEAGAANEIIAVAVNCLTVSRAA